MAKKQRKVGDCFKQFNRLIDTIDSVCTDGSMTIGQRRLLLSIVDTIDQKYINLLPMDR
jgi:hypothetical protein